MYHQHNTIYFQDYTKESQLTLDPLEILKVHRLLVFNIQKHKLIIFQLTIFLHLKAEFHCCYVLALPVILRLKYVNTWELLRSPGKEIKVIAILSLKNLFQPAITRPDFEEFSMLATNNIYFEVALTLQRPKFPSYRSQLVDLQSKSTDWFIYYGNIGC